MRWPWQKRHSVETPSTPLTPANISEAMGVQGSASGISVTPESALYSPAVSACLRVLSEAVASLPLFLYKSNDDGDKEKATGSPLYEVLHTRTNPDLSSYRWRRLAMRHLLIDKGRHVARIERNGAGRVVGLYPLEPDSVTVRRVNGRLQYEVQLNNNGREIYDGSQVVDFTLTDDVDGIGAWSIVENAKEAIGTALALDQFGGRFFSNGARPGLVLKYPGQLSQGSIDNIKASLQATQGGLKNAFKAMILEEGVDATTVTISPDDSQYVESKTLQTIEIARAFNVPPSFIQDLERATFSNSEQQDLHFVKHTLTPYITMMEQELTYKLAPRGHYVRFNVDGMLRGDFEARMRGYATGVNSGILMPNEARDLEERPAEDGGDQLFIQGATVPLTSAGDEPQGNENVE